MKNSLLTTLSLALLTTSTLAQNVIANRDSHAMVAIFGDEHIADNAFAVHRRAMKMPVEERYEYLADWVLPNSLHNTIRTAIAFTPTHPAPPVWGKNQFDVDRLRLAEEAGLSRVQVGGRLIAPAFDLVEVAKELGRLDEVLKRTDQFIPANDKQKRSRLAMLIAVDTELGDFLSARNHLEALLPLVQTGGHTSFAERSPETFAIWMALRHPENRDTVQAIIYHILSTQLRLNIYSGVPAWEVHLQSMWNRANELNQEHDGEPNQPFGTPPALQQWSGTNRVLSISRGGGHSQSHWKASTGRIENLSIHCDDYLFFQSPLRGNFEVECDISPFAWRDSTIYVAGKWVAPVYTLTSYKVGNVRGEQPRRRLPRKLGTPREWFRYRAVVRDNVFSTYFNGRKIHDEPLPSEHEPWLAIRSVLRNTGVTRGLRITGNPVIPESVRLSTLPEIPGWMPYFKESVGRQNSSWRQSGFSFLGGGIVGIRKSRKAQMGMESLLYYVRPMLEDGEIEYDFYYQKGQTLTHPALDRLAFMLDPGGVRIHWITDGKYDRTDLDPMNVTDEPANRRGPENLPLKDNAWNKMKLSLVGNTIHLFLNGEEVYERELEVTNQRTFGLFHYSDRSEARVRNIVWKGDWPRELPAVKDQELAGEGTDFLDVDLPKLTAVFEHDFAIAGLQEDRIRVFGTGWQRFITEQPDGVQMARTGEVGKYLTDTIAPRCVIRGDFDITVSYKKFTPLLPQSTKETKCSLILTVLLDDESQTQTSLYRRDVRRDGEEDLRLYQGMILQTEHKEARRTYFGTTTFEAESGTLRLARRGKELYYLIAEGDSSYFRLIATETLNDADLLPDGIHIQSQVYGPGSSSVVWKNLTVRAEQLMDLPPSKSFEPKNLYVMNSDGSDLKMVIAVPEGYIHFGSPEWSADGKQITFDASNGGTGSSHVMVINTDGTNLRDLGMGSMPSFSEDGKRMVFSYPGQGVLMMNADGTGRKTIDRGAWGVQWSPDGKHIAYGKSGNITILTPDTGEERQLLVGDQASGYRSIYWNFGWSHDSRSICAKARNRKTNAEEVIVADIDSADGFKVLNSGVSGINPDITWGPENKNVLFAMYNSSHKGLQLYLSNRENPAVPKLLPGQPLDMKIYDCAWSPDGKKIVFSGQLFPQQVKWPPVDD